MVQIRHNTCVNRPKTRTFSGADVGSGPLSCHDGLQSALEEIRLKFDLVNLKYPDTPEEFQASIGGRFAPLLLLDEDLDAIMNNLNIVMSETANRVLGENQLKSKPWDTGKILKLCDVRRKLKKEKNNLEERSEYRKTNKEFKREMKEAKERRIVKQCADIMASFSKKT